MLVRSDYSHSIPNDIRNGLVILLTSVFFLISGITSPSYNWDIVAYVAAAYQQAGLSGSELSSATYNEIEREVDAETFKELTVGEYVDVVFKDPKSLEQQMPFYSIKVVYIQLIRVLKTFGLSYTRSTYTISAIFTSASVLMIALFLLHFGVPVLWTACCGNGRRLRDDCQLFDAGCDRLLLCALAYLCVHQTKQSFVCNFRFAAAHSHGFGDIVHLDDGFRFFP